LAVLVDTDATLAAGGVNTRAGKRAPVGMSHHVR